MWDWAVGTHQSTPSPRRIDHMMSCLHPCDVAVQFAFHPLDQAIRNILPYNGQFEVQHGWDGYETSVAGIVQAWYRW